MTLRDTTDVTNGVYPHCDAEFATQSNPANLVQFDADIWGTKSTSGKYVDLTLAMLSGTTALNSVLIHADASSGSISVGGTGTSLTWGLTAWHHVTMDYYPTTSTFTLAVDSQTPQTFAMTTPSAVSGFRFVQTSPYYNRWSCFDNVQVTGTVPEPSSIALTVSALLGLVAYAWRRWR